jgi:hypothetical protein
MQFVVILEVRVHGAPCGSTQDVIEAASADLAVREATRLWRAAMPGRTFAPLLVIQQPAA